MSTLPFTNVRDDPAASGVLSVSDLTRQIKATLQADFGDVGVAGEISGLSRPGSGHVYISLKDAGAQIGAVIWKSAAQKLRFELEIGQAVRAWGAIEIYPPQGKYQLIIRKIEPQGVGTLELAFRQTVERLKAEGLFDPERKRPLPVYPRRIVVVTSPTGAAVRDFVQVATRRWPMAEILIAATRVQGNGAAEEIASALALANRLNDVDFVVVTRGGGSLEDLWAFNEEIVARAIFASRLPVVSAIGHEVDVTVADLVADLRAFTPTDAANRCVPDLNEIRITLDAMGARMARALSEPIVRAKHRLESLGDRASRALVLKVEKARSELGRMSERLDRAIHAEIDRRSDVLAKIAAQFEALSPLKVLARGYSLTLKDDGKTVVRSAADVATGDTIQTRLGSGTIASQVL